MGKKAELDITESPSALKKLLLKQKTIKVEKRIKCLLEIKSGRCDTRQDLADHLLLPITIPICMSSGRLISMVATQ